MYLKCKKSKITKQKYFINLEKIARQTIRLSMIKDSIMNLEKIDHWEETAEKKYNLMLSKIPIFHREITKQVVNKKAVINAKDRNSSIVEEQDIVRAFLSEVPKAFYSMMIRIMDDVGFDHAKYENTD